MSKYSFVLPAYKTRFLDESLASICGQTISDYKVIISDDCSPENVYGLVEKYLEDERISYRRNDINMGSDALVDHWNMLLEQCDSEYVIMASDDDIYAPNFLEEVDRVVTLHPNVDLIRVRAQIIDENGHVQKIDSECPEVFSLNDLLHHFINPGSVLCIGNYVFKTEQLKRLGGFVRFPLGWKSDTATEIAMAANGVACISDSLFSFRMSGINISSNQERDSVKDAEKLDAIVQFDSWLSERIGDKKMLMIFRNRLEGEARSYYWTLDRKTFSRLFKRMCKDGWFRTVRNRLSFLWGWLVV